MNLTPIIISYRSECDQTSHFLNVDDLLKEQSSKKLKQIYIDIFKSVTAYDPDHVDSLIKVENKLYERITLLEKIIAGTGKKLYW